MLPLKYQTTKTAEKMETTIGFKKGDVVLWKDCWCAGEILEVNGKIAKIAYLNEVINKRVSSLKPYSTPEVYICEQERGYNQSRLKHGETCFSVMSDTGGGIYVWDSVKQDVVLRQELTQL